MTSSTTASTLLNTVGPFLLFSNTWSSLRIFLRRKNTDTTGTTTLMSNKTQQRPAGTIPAIRIFFERAVRFLAVILGLRLTNGLTSGRSPPIRKVLIFSSASILHYLFQPYHWTLSLYFSLRATGLNLVRNRTVIDRSWPVALVRHPLCIFILHCFHNFFLTHCADLVSPHYVRLWLQVLPIKYTKLHSWLKDFSRDSCQTQHYRSEQCGAARLAILPKRMAVSLKRQLPLVAATFVLPVVLFKRGKLMQSPLVLFWDVAVKIVRSSLVLTALPFMLTEFPCFWGLATGQPKDSTVRRPMLHTFCVSLLSTGVFLLEPVNRLRMLVVYTYWRVSEVVMLNTIKGLSTDADGPIEQRVAEVLTGLTALVSSI